jgi:hypothetical protein
MYTMIFLSRNRECPLATHLSDYLLFKGPGFRNYLPNEFGKKGQLQSDLTGFNILSKQKLCKATLFTEHMYRVRMKQFKAVVAIGTEKTILNSVYFCVQNRDRCRALVNAVMNFQVPQNAANFFYS